MARAVLALKAAFSHFIALRATLRLRTALIGIIPLKAVLCLRMALVHMILMPCMKESHHQDTFVCSTKNAYSGASYISKHGGSKSVRQGISTYPALTRPMRSREDTAGMYRTYAVLSSPCSDFPLLSQTPPFLPCRPLCSPLFPAVLFFDNK